MKKQGWMTEERLTRLLFSLRWYANRWGNKDGQRFSTIRGTGFGKHGALDAVVGDRSSSDWDKDLRKALEALVALGLVEKRLIGAMIPGRTFKVYLWGLTPAGFTAKGVGSITFTAEQLADLDQAIAYHRDDEKRRKERIKIRNEERAAEACAS